MDVLHALFLGISVSYDGFLAAGVPYVSCVVDWLFFCLIK
jgi:hypothetical protein